MNLESAINKASEYAYEIDADAIVGIIDGRWRFAHVEDLSRINQMDENPRIRVFGDGLRAAEVAEDLSEMDECLTVAGKTKTWTFADGSQIVLSRNSVEVKGEQS